MGSTSFLLLATLLALAITMPASALKCGECNDGVDSSKCSSGSVSEWTCPQGWDRCFIAKVTYKVNNSAPVDVVMKNCTSTDGCNSTSQYYVCNYVNDTGTATSCDVTTCCEGDLCNHNFTTTTAAPTTTQATMAPTSAVFGLAASLIATCLAVGLTMFV